MTTPSLNDPWRWHLYLSVRAENRLEIAKIETLAELVSESRASLRRMRGVGRTTVGEIEQQLQRCGLEFGAKTGSYYPPTCSLPVSLRDYFAGQADEAWAIWLHLYGNETMPTEAMLLQQVAMIRGRLADAMLAEREKEVKA